MREVRLKMLHLHQTLLEMERAFAARVWPSLLQPLQRRDEWIASLRTALEREAWEAFVDRPLEYGPGSPPREDPEADESVGDLHELAERLAD